MVSDETGEKAMVDCKNGTTDNTSTIEKLLLDVEDLSSNSTSDNETRHCAKTEFGCCPDWITIAEGANNEGCPEFVLGVYYIPNISLILIFDRLYNLHYHHLNN